MTLRTIAVFAVAFSFAACADSDRQQIDRLNDQPSGAQLRVSDFTIDTAEDTPFAGTLDTGGYTGTVASRVTAQGHLGTLTFSDDGKSYRYAPLANANGNDTVAIAVGDGVQTLNAVISVMVTPVNDAPVCNVPPPQTGTQDVAFVFTGAATVQVADIDAGDAPLLVALSADNGTITLSSTAGLTFTTGDGTDDARLGFSGSQTAINAALAGLTVTPATHYNGLLTLTLTANDQGASGAGGAKSDTETFSIGLGAVDLPPFNTAPGEVMTAEDTPLAFTGVNTVTVSDSDSTTVTVDLVVDSGTLSVGTTNLTFTNGDGTNEAHLTFSGTISDVNAGLAALTFTPALDSDAAATITLVSDDGQLQDTSTITVTVNPVNDAPVISAPISASMNEDTTLAFTGVLAIAVSDVDVGSAALAYTITATHGKIAATGHDAATSLTGSDTLTVINQFLPTLIFTPDEGFTGSASLTIDVNDQGNTGSGGPQSATATIPINVTLVGGAPVASNDAYSTAGNTVLHVDALTGVLADDADADGAVTVVSTDAITTTLGGTVTIAADGSFVYKPKPGARTTNDTFMYTIADTDGNRASATVTVTLTLALWYVDNSVPAPAVSDGESESPFVDVGSAVAAAQHGDLIYVAPGAGPYAYTSFTLNANLVGGGASVFVPPNVNLAATSKSVLQSEGTITMLDGVTIEGVTLQATNGGTGVTSASGASVSLAGTTIINHSPGIYLADFASVSLFQANVTGSQQAGIQLHSTGSSATLEMTNTVTRNSAGNGIAIDVTAGTLTATISAHQSFADQGKALSFSTLSSGGGRLTVTGGLYDGFLNTPVSTIGIVVAAYSSATTYFDIEAATIRGDAMSAIQIEALTRTIGRIHGCTFSDTGGDTDGQVIIQSMGSVAGDNTLDIIVDGNTFAGDVQNQLAIQATEGILCAGITSNTLAGSSDAFVLEADASLLIDGYDTSGDLVSYLTDTEHNDLMSGSITGVISGGTCATLPAN